MRRLEAVTTWTPGMEAAVSRLREALPELAPMVVRILVARGLETPQEVKAFLKPSLDALRDPFLMEGMQEAVEWLEEAIEAGVPITIFGDYDCDGISATALLLHYLSGRGAQVDSYIPRRLEEGYGLNKAAIHQLAEQGTELLLTVDCGISALEEVALAAELGMTVIITDHHEPARDGALPAAQVILNPKVQGGGLAYPFDGLCGTGVAAKLVQAMGGREALLPFLDLIALATIADIVPLRDENRVFAALGLEKLNANPHPGLAALIEVSGLKGRKLLASHVGFALAPRLNAGGRLGEAGRGLRLLMSADPAERAAIAQTLDGENNERREIEAELLEEAISQAETQLGRRVLVVAGAGWHHGVAGIVASRLVERYSRPALVLGIEEGLATGSGRSIPGVNLYDMLSGAAELMERFGGHAAAAGLTLKEENLGALQSKLEAWCFAECDEALWVPALRYDIEAPLKELTLRTAEALTQLEPCGFGHTAPSFHVQGELRELNTMGAQGQHLRFTLTQEGAVLPVKAFNAARRLSTLKPGLCYDALVRLEVDEFRGRNLSARLMDLSPRPVARNLWLLTQGWQANFERAALLGHWSPYVEDTATAENLEEAVLEARLEDWLRESLWSTLVLVRSREGFKMLLALLNRRGLMERMELSGEAPLGLNALLVAPARAALPEGYTRLVFFDAPVSAFGPLFLPDSTQAIICRQEPMPGMENGNKAFVNARPALVSRPVIASLYRALPSDGSALPLSTLLEQGEWRTEVLEAAVGVLGDLKLCAYVVREKELWLCRRPDVQIGPKRALEDSLLFQQWGQDSRG